MDWAVLLCISYTVWKNTGICGWCLCDVRGSGVGAGDWISGGEGRLDTLGMKVEWLGFLEGRCRWVVLGVWYSLGYGGSVYVDEALVRLMQSFLSRGFRRVEHRSSRKSRSKALR